MNNIKKFLSLLFVAVFAFVLIGCTGGNENKTLLEEQADKIYLGDLSEVNNDIKLPKYAFGNKEFPVTWSSSNEVVIKIQEYENDDKDVYYQAYVTMALEETKVTLTATVTYKDLTTTRTFEVNVLADEYQGYTSVAAVKAQEGKTKDVSKVKFTGTVAFSTSSGFGVTDGTDTMYCYGSGHGRTVGERVEVRGIWTFYNNMVQLKESNVKVLGTDADFNIANIAEEKTLTEIFAIKAESVDPVNSTRIFKTKFAAKANPSGSYNTYRLVDPIDNSKTVDVSKYNDASTLEEVGALAASEKFYEGIIIIYCSRSAGAAGLWDVLFVPGSAKEVEITLTDAQKVSGIITNLNDQFNGKTIKANMELPTSDENTGATIAWASDNENVISSTGVYVAPAAMTEVKLTATITLNNEVQTVEITVKAAAKQTSVLEYVKEIEVGKAYKLGVEQTNLEKTLFATGEIDGKYGKTTEDYASAAEVYFETAEGGYYVYFLNGETKTYISATGTTAADGKVSFSLVYGEKSTVWTFDTTHYTLKTNVENTDVYFGCYNEYATISVSKFSYISTSFPSRFYVLGTPVEEEKPEPEPTEKEATIAEVLTAAKDLADQAKLEGKYKVTGTVTEITGEYSTEYKNVTFIISDGTNTLEVFRAKGAEAANVAVGDTVVLVGEIQKYGEKIQLVSGQIQSRTAAGGSTTPEPEESVIKQILDAAKDLADKAYLDGEFTVTAEVSEITDGYSAEYENISFMLTDGTNAILVFRAKGAEAANVAAGDTVTLTGKVQNYGGTIEIVNATISARVPGEGSGNNQGSEDPTINADVVLDFVSKFETYAASWGSSYTAQEVTNTDLGVSTALKVSFSRANKQPAGNSIDDRPVAAANASTEYITVTLTNDKAAGIEFDLQQWSTKSFSSIVIEYFDGTNWVKCSNEITTPGKLSATLGDNVNQVRLAFTTSQSKNTQLGLTAITIDLK